MAAPEQPHRSVEGLTIPALLRENARRHPDRPALTTGIGPDDGTLTWFQLRSEVAALTRGLAAVGLRRGERMLIAMSRRAEHWVADLAAVHLGALPCSTHDTLSAERIRHVVRHSAPTVLVLEGEEQTRSWGPVLDDLPDLRAVVVLDWNAATEGDKRFVSYQAVRGSGPLDTVTFEALTDEITTDQPLSVVYTAGTTGEPERVVLTHRDVIHESFTQARLLALPKHPRTVAHLSPAHIAERMLGVYLPVCAAGHVTICRDPAQLPATLLHVRPHAFFGVPGVWEKLAAALRARLGEESGEARELALETYRLRSATGSVPANLSERLTRLDEQELRPLRAAIGLDHCRGASSGAAPVPTAVLETLASVGLPVHEGWDLGETTGAATAGTQGGSRGT